METEISTGLRTTCSTTLAKSGSTCPACAFSRGLSAYGPTARESENPHFRMKALPHFGPSMRDENGAVGVHMDQSTTLIHELRRKVDAELSGEQS
eukprot:scaffold66575_cov31-Tisochrysis_lutea.AAC.9